MSSVGGGGRQGGAGRGQTTISLMSVFICFLCSEKHQQVLQLKPENQSNRLYIIPTLL